MIISNKVVYLQKKTRLWEFLYLLYLSSMYSVQCVEVALIGGNKIIGGLDMIWGILAFIGIMLEVFISVFVTGNRK